jgi:K+-transporting ATPase KdpF subunit
MGDFLVIAGVVIFALAMLGLIRGLDPDMTVTEGVLLALSVAVFIYLAVALFKAEWPDGLYLDNHRPDSHLADRRALPRRIYGGRPRGRVM